MKNNGKASIPTVKLMERITVSDEFALQALFDRLWEQMYSLAYVIVKDKEKAKDIVQEVWISFWERRKTIKNQNIEGYLLQATRFGAYKEIRGAKLQRFTEELLSNIKDSESNSIIETLYLDDTEKLLKKSIDSLPKKCKEVFVLSRYTDLENAEISKKLGITIRTVETHISHALRRIRSEVSLPITLLFSIFI